MRSFLVALAFLTIIPVRFRVLPDESTVARSRFWFPIVGLLLGLLLGGWTLTVSQFASPMIGAFLVLTVWVLITGALHLDGFCDLCDGLFGGSTPEDRLRIMKEPTRGTFAMAGCVLLLLGKFVAIDELLTSKRIPDLAAWAVCAAIVVSRCLLLTVAAGAHYPRNEGTGRIIVEATRSREAVLFSLLGAIVLGSFFLVIPHLDIFRPLVDSPRVIYLLPRADIVWRLGLIFVASWLAMLGIRKLAEHRLGGITGDCLGAAIEVMELTFLMGAAMLMKE